MQPDKTASLSKRALKPERILALGFLALILAGGILLALPVSGAGGRSIGLFSGLFTATSAVCVTGLSIVDVGLELSSFGQIVLLMLIQVGGLGFMAFGTIIMVALGKRISLKSRMLLRDSMNQSGLSGMVRLTLSFFLLALVIEVVGALLLMTRLIPLYGGKGIWYSLFTAISAFCNAGFDLFGNYQSLIPFQQEPMVLLTVALLILLGGLGFSVILEVAGARFHWRRLSLHAKLVLSITGILLVFGTVCTLGLEWGNSGTLHAGLSPIDKLANGFFQSVTTRTAGFAAVDQAALTDPSKLICVLLMFIGASSASTGGGVKTTTAAMIVLVVIAVIRGRERITIFGREIGAETARRAVAIVLLAIALVLVCTCALSVIERGRGFDMLDLLYEATSAFSTTGLSTIGTARLSRWSQLLLMPLMYLGRVGPLTLAFALADRRNASTMSRMHYPEEKIMIG